MKKKIDIKTLLPVLIPLIAAVLVVSTLAISGKIAKNKDEASPSATFTQSEVTETEKKIEDSKVTIVAVGDNLIHDTLIAAGMNDNGTRNYEAFYENISPYIKAADIAVINQETMLGGDSFPFKGYPCFNTPWEVGEAAIDAGFDVFTCATNHSMDVERTAGIEKELEFFSKHPEVTHIGTYGSEEDYNAITYYEKNGITFALLNYTYGTNGISIPENKYYSVTLLREDKVRKDVTEARKNADVVIVFPHWGTVDSHGINAQQKKYVKIFSELGVDIVIGTHPHVLEPVEWVKNEETGKKMLVYYSLGNFISHQAHANELVGGMAEITVERVDGEIQITNAKLAPVVTFFNRPSGKYKFTVYKFSDYTSELANSQSRDDLSVKYAENLAKEYISEEFLDLN